MKRRLILISQITLIFLLLVGCKRGEVNNKKEKELKETTDLVLSYNDGYDETMKKHINEGDFYICNYKEFYSLYFGETIIEKYESEIKNIKEMNGQYVVDLILNIEAKSTEIHEDEDGNKGSDTAIGENIPVEIILKNKDGEYYITSFTEYEDLEKAAELNENFK
ncbi:hypothetical protein [Clostridium sp.]|uniref:hypothetical protein n=1 Tax=Clostridium sp. TaxID=1506 RepID=UPI0026243084|nr:hypothetical protein [Clostridium sp.]